MFVHKKFCPKKILVKKNWSKNFGKKYLVKKKFDQKKFQSEKKIWSKKIMVQNILIQKNLVQKFFVPRNILVRKKILVQKDFVSQIYFLPYGNQLQRQRSCQKLGVEKLSKRCPMTFLTMLQTSSVYKSCKWKLSAASGTYSGSARLGSARLTCKYNAISVQLQLQLPTGTELGNISKRSHLTSEVRSSSSSLQGSSYRSAEKVQTSPVVFRNSQATYGCTNRLLTKLYPICPSPKIVILT